MGLFCTLFTIVLFLATMPQPCGQLSALLPCWHHLFLGRPADTEMFLDTLVEPHSCGIFHHVHVPSTSLMKLVAPDWRAYKLNYIMCRCHSNVKTKAWCWLQRHKIDLIFTSSNLWLEVMAVKIWSNDRNGRGCGKITTLPLFFVFCFLFFFVFFFK